MNNKKLINELECLIEEAATINRNFVMIDDYDEWLKICDFPEILRLYKELRKGSTKSKE